MNVEKTVNHGVHGDNSNTPSHHMGESFNAAINSLFLPRTISCFPRAPRVPRGSAVFKINASTRQLILLCLALLVMRPASAEISGRLFFTPEQRAMLDNARRQNVQQATEEQAAMSGGVTFNGVVQRSDGRSTVWVNNRPISGADATNRFVPSKNGNPVLKMPYPGQSVDLKVGQRLDPVTGKAVEPYQGRPKNEPAKETPKPASNADKEKVPDKRAPLTDIEPESHP